MWLRPAVGHSPSHNRCGTIMGPRQCVRNASQESNMSARKLGRFAGLFFVLVFAVGGVAAAGAHETGSASAIEIASLSINWD